MLRNTHVEMLPLETKQSGGKLLPHSDLRGGGGGGFTKGGHRGLKFFLDRWRALVGTVRNFRVS
jgi:hypothetical protein